MAFTTHCSRANDEYFVLKDFDSYFKTWEQSDPEIYQDHHSAGAKCRLTNIAMAGDFSSDRTIRQYCEDIWHAHCDKLK